MDPKAYARAGRNAFISDSAHPRPPVPPKKRRVSCLRRRCGWGEARGEGVGVAQGHLDFSNSARRGTIAIRPEAKPKTHSHNEEPPNG